MCWFTLHTAATAGAETDGIQELHSGLSPTWVQGSKHIGHFVVLSQSHLQGSAQEVQQLGLESVPKCDATITDSQTCYATSPGPKPAYSTPTSLNSNSLRFLEGKQVQLSETIHSANSGFTYCYSYQEPLSCTSIF